MSICGKIIAGIDFDCDQPIVPGVDERLILVNKDDMDDALISYDIVNDYVIEDIILADGIQGFAFEGNRQSLNPQYDFIPQTTTVGYDHTINFLGFDISPESKDNLEKMALGKMVAIIENNQGRKGGNGDNFFEVYGLDVGLEVITMTRIPADLENGAAFVIQLKTSDNAGKEPLMPPTWFDTDYITTKALVDALLIPAGP